MHHASVRFVPVTVAMSGGIAASMTDDLLSLAQRAGARLRPERVPLGQLPSPPVGRRTWWVARRA